MIEGRGQPLDELRGECVVGRPPVLLRGVAGVKRDRGDARLLDEPPRELDAGSLAGPLSRAQLDRDRQAAALGRGARERERRVRLVEQRRARTGLADLAHRAAHVDVDHLGAALGDDRRGGAHRVRVMAEQLDRERMLVGMDAQELAVGAGVAVLEPEARDHLGDGETGPVALRLQAHEPVADARKRREHEPVRQVVTGESPRFGKAHRLQRRTGSEIPFYARLRSQMSRSPVSVSRSSTSSIWSQNGTIEPARPPVAIAVGSSPICSRRRPRMPSTCPAKP